MASSIPWRRTALGILVLASMAVARPALAWDPEADRAVALLAYERLNPTARGDVDVLLQGGTSIAGCPVDSLDDDARLMDCLHGSKADPMRDVVYDAAPLCPAATPRPPCPDGRCASMVLTRELQVLGDRSAARPDRVLALETVAYLMAEIHQPLHVADNGDRSGDHVRVVLAGSPKARVSLYSVWDNDLVASAIGTAESGLPYLRALADAHAADWAQGDVSDWLAQSHDVALHTAYGALPEPPPCNRMPAQPELLGRSYFAVAAPAVREQLARAGVRLATVLNATLH